MISPGRAAGRLVFRDNINLFLLIFLLFTHLQNTIQARNPIALKYGTHEKGYRTYHGSKFGLNISINGWVWTIIDKNMTAICCHSYRANGLCYEAENRYMDCFNIEPLWFVRNQSGKIEAWVANVIEIYYYYSYSNRTVTLIEHSSEIHTRTFFMKQFQKTRCAPTACPV